MTEQTTLHDGDPCGVCGWALKRETVCPPPSLFTVGKGTPLGTVFYICSNKNCGLAFGTGEIDEAIAIRDAARIESGHREYHPGIIEWGRKR